MISIFIYSKSSLHQSKLLYLIKSLKLLFNSLFKRSKLIGLVDKVNTKMYN